MLVGGGQADRLAADLDAAIANGARRLLSFGIAGGLSPHLRAGDLILAKGVREGQRRLSCDPAWRAMMSGRLLQSRSSRSRLQRPLECALKDDAAQLESGQFRFDSNTGWLPIVDAGDQPQVADIASVDAPLADAESKGALFMATGAIAVDMESAVVARAAQRHGLPFAVLRVIADPAHRPLPSAALVAMRTDGEVDTGAVLSALVRDPAQLSSLVRLAFDSRSAFSALVRARGLLGEDFASSDLSDIPVKAAQAREGNLWHFVGMGERAGDNILRDYAMGRTICATRT